jgi:cell division protein FtsB
MEEKSNYEIYGKFIKVVAKTEYDKLKAENEALKEALKTIHSHLVVLAECPYEEGISDIATRVEQLLNGGK